MRIRLHLILSLILAVSVVALTFAYFQVRAEKLGLRTDLEMRAELTQRYLGTYGVARDISERKRAEEIISFQAYHDQLTHLPNRVLFKDRLELAIAQAHRKNGNLAVMFVDIDRFKLVNDTFGHSEGDLLLQGVASRLKETLRRGDTLARLGGDEFTILLPDVNHPEDARSEEHTSELQSPLNLV